MRPPIVELDSLSKTWRDRFWQYVDNADAHDCWDWLGSLGSTGYGQLNIARYPFKVHRLSYFLFNGSFDESLGVLHTCDNPVCVNPEHLFLGTQADNMQDASQKGRVRNRPMPGESNPASKLTEDLVREARRRYVLGESLHSLARRYDVNRKTITQAVTGERWSHV